MYQIQKQWQDEMLHRPYYSHTKQADDPLPISDYFVKVLKAETQGFVIAAQEKWLVSRNY